MASVDTAAPEAAQAASVAVVSKVSEETAKQLRQESAALYVRVQRDWFEFARKLTQIFEANAFIALGHESFSAFCETEYKEVAQSTLSKMVQVVTEFGPALEARMLAQPESPVPSLDRLYELLVARKKYHDDKSVQRKIGHMTPKVINGEVSYTKQKEFLSGIRESKLAEVTPETKAKAEALENDLVKDIKASGELDEMSDTDRAAIAIVNQAPPLSESMVAIKSAILAKPDQEIGAKVEDAMVKLNELLIQLDQTLEWFEAFQKARKAAKAS